MLSPLLCGRVMASGAAPAPALMTLHVMGTIRAYVSAKQCGLSLVLSKEIRATTIGFCVGWTMSISAGAGPGIGWWMLPQLGQGARVREGLGQRLASDHSCPLEAETGKIVRGSTTQRCRPRRSLTSTPQRAILSTMESHRHSHGSADDHRLCRRAAHEACTWSVPGHGASAAAHRG
jgi:hypothetical protein